MLKKIMTAGLFACSVQAMANEEYTIEVKPDNSIVASEGIDIKSIEVLEGTEAIEWYQNDLLEQLDALTELNTVTALAKSEVLIEKLAFADSLVEKLNKNQSSSKDGTVGNSVGYCGVTQYLKYTFVPGKYRYNLETRASTGIKETSQGAEPVVLLHELFAESIIFNSSPKTTIIYTDIDIESDESMFVSAVANVGSGFHLEGEDVSFISQGLFFISLPGCDSFKTLRVSGLKTWNTAPSNVVVTIQ